MYENTERFKIIPNNADALILASLSGIGGLFAVATLIDAPRKEDREQIDSQIYVEEAKYSTLNSLQLELAIEGETTTGVSNVIAAQRMEVHQTILELEAAKPEPTTNLEVAGGVFGAIGLVGAIATAIRYRAHRKAARKQNSRIGTDAPVID